MEGLPLPVSRQRVFTVEHAVDDLLLAGVQALDAKDAAQQPAMLRRIARKPDA
jgi:hypothetical protein